MSFLFHALLQLIVRNGTQQTIMGKAAVCSYAMTAAASYGTIQKNAVFAAHLSSAQIGPQLDFMEKNAACNHAMMAALNHGTIQKSAAHASKTSLAHGQA